MNIGSFRDGSMSVSRYMTSGGVSVCRLRAWERGLPPRVSPLCGGTVSHK